MRAAADSVPNLEILQTTTTRPHRKGEVDGREYVFVTSEEYAVRQAAAEQWDHLEYHGHKYGTDRAAVIAKLARGRHLICTITPDPRAVKMLERAYGVKAITIWLEVPETLAASRISSDAARSARIEDESAKQAFQHVFTPSGALTDDVAAFARLVWRALPGV